MISEPIDLGYPRFVFTHQTK